MTRLELELWIAEIQVATLAAYFDGDKELERDLEDWRGWVHWAKYTGEWRNGL